MPMDAQLALIPNVGLYQSADTISSYMSKMTQFVSAKPFKNGIFRGQQDEVALEEPLSLRVSTPQGSSPLTTLMRTPGHDRELLLGWLLAEGLLPESFELQSDAENPNVWHLKTSGYARLLASARLTVMTSACGVCGTGNIEQLLSQVQPPLWKGPLLTAEVLTQLPARLAATQPGFIATGGLHAAALFSSELEHLNTFEDIGRHNATDKALGWAYLEGLDASQLILCVSSRAGFEIVQKAVAAGVCVVMSVGAATSLAIETAQSFGLTLLAFAREGRFTVYSGGDRFQLLADSEPLNVPEPKKP